MTTTAELRTDAYGRIRGLVHSVLDGFDDGTLTAPSTRTRTRSGNLMWHLTPVQDGRPARVAGTEQVFTARGRAQRFGLPFDASAVGHLPTSDEVAQVALSADPLPAVHSATVGYLDGEDDEALDRVVDTRWDPPVAFAVRLVGVVSDDQQHVGRAAFIRGVFERQG